MSVRVLIMGDPVEFIVGDAIFGKIRPRVKAARVKLNDAVITTHPEASLAIRIYGVNIIIREAFTAAKLPVLALLSVPADQPCIGSSQPVDALLILVEMLVTLRRQIKTDL